MIPVPANLPLAVTLEAQAWNTIMTALGEAPYKLVAPLIQSITEQLQQAARIQMRPAVATDGLDPDPPGGEARIGG
jgi:hypothetical protein